MTEIFGSPIMGGGGSDLNFKAIAVASESALPSTAAENTIAVITTTPITSYVFSSTAPTSPTEGMVWFATGTASGVGFNAIKRNGLWVYPTDCQQYVSGAWVSKTAKTYTGGAWVDWWHGDLYDSGNEYDFVTGGWGSSGSVTKNATSITVTGASTFPTAYTNEKIDLSPYSALAINITAVQKVQYGITLAVGTKKIYATDASRIAYLDSDMVVGINMLDVSAINGAYYIQVSGYDGSATFDRIWLT